MGIGIGPIGARTSTYKTSLEWSNFMILTLILITTLQKKPTLFELVLTSRYPESVSDAVAVLKKNDIKYFTSGGVLYSLSVLSCDYSKAKKLINTTTRKTR